MSDSLVPLTALIAIQTSSLVRAYSIDYLRTKIQQVHVYRYTNNKAGSTRKSVNSICTVLQQKSSNTFGKCIVYQNGNVFDKKNPVHLSNVAYIFQNLGIRGKKNRQPTFCKHSSASAFGSVSTSYTTELGSFTKQYVLFIIPIIVAVIYFAV